jgi:hypothetical protein
LAVDTRHAKSKEEVEEELKVKIREIKSDFIETLISENPGILKSLNKVFAKQGIKMGIVMSMLISGIYSLVNAATIYFGLTYEGWLWVGLPSTLLGAILTLRSYFQS